MVGLLDACGSGLNNGGMAELELVDEGSAWSDSRMISLLGAGTSEVWSFVVQSQESYDRVWAAHSNSGGLAKCSRDLNALS